MPKAETSWLNDPRVNTFLWAGVLFFSGTVFNDMRGTINASADTITKHSKDLAVVDVRFAGYDAMRPQVQDVMMRVQNIERKLDQVLESKLKGR